MSLASRWIGTEGAAFERVGLAFEALGYRAPSPDTNADGAYACNIAGQYVADMSKGEAMAVISFGLAHDRAYLRQAKGIELWEITRTYGD